MHYALTINIGIILVIVAGLILTSNPLVLLGLFFLRDMPYQLEAMKLGAEDDEPSNPIGFTTD
ncbi:hypothetical protein [Cupriavidus campinensis]|uniref:Uncharacterized protein n=1 Tax=Cupriavidus campinensis TaxID=151783 RepID=A0ABY3ESI8_9BURK|nr:hypothetical protein [Cupriavidus campinensis]TSP13934.1 hypothetical protein FGG12_05515 [Cupriavidus campinensis]